MSALASLEERLKILEDKCVLYDGIIDTSRRVVAAQDFKVECAGDTPQIIKESECGGLELGNNGCWQMLDTLTEEVSHTGDTDETVVHTALVPAGRMGANGIVKISSLHCRPYANSKFNVYWGEVAAPKKIGYWSHTGTYYIFARSIEIWNKDATNAQSAGSCSAAIALGAHFVVAGTPIALTEDTEQDVNIYVTIQNADAGHTSYLYHMETELYNGDS